VELSDPSAPRGDPASAIDPDSAELTDLRRQVAAYVAAGADESVQRVISAVHRVSRRLNQWYDQQLADLDVSGGEWAVLSEIARADGNWLTPTQLARLAHVAPSSMTHRLDRMVDRDLVKRTPDPTNRTRILVGLTESGWALYGSDHPGVQPGRVRSDARAHGAPGRRPGPPAGEAAGRPGLLATPQAVRPGTVERRRRRRRWLIV
jgi:DNA-binding MarR family transcriptional regulator